MDRWFEEWMEEVFCNNKEEKMVFKVGDKVRVKKGMEKVPGKHDLEPGRVYTVSRAPELSEFIELDHQWMTYHHSRLELVQDTKPEFKVGDRVRFTKKNARGADVEVGDLGTITKIAGHNISVRPDVMRRSGWKDDWYVSEEHLELVTDDLQQLVDKANEGLDALVEIHRNHPTKVYFTNPFDVTLESDFTLNEMMKKSVEITEARHRLRIKTPPKPTLIPFTTSNGWKVELKGEELAIGCKTFTFSNAKNIMRAFMSDRKSDHVGITGARYRATRDGVVMDDHYTLYWPDAEKLHEELKKVG